jgi:hypothetical protein
MDAGQDILAVAERAANQRHVRLRRVRALVDVDVEAAELGGKLCGGDAAHRRSAVAVQERTDAFTSPLQE